MQGFFNVNKPKGVTSAFVVGRLKKHFNIKKIGHMGTLDPMAQGVLPIAVGKAARLFNYLLEADTKQYLAVFQFGYETNTLDAEGEIIKENGLFPTKEELLKASSGMVGKFAQMPPQFSAKKINGKKAYDYAREGIEVELKSKEIEIFELELIKQISDNEFQFLITCSSGTYIRSIGRDLGVATNTLCTMTQLVRTKVGCFNIENSIDFEKLMQSNNAKAYITATDSVLNFDTIEIDTSSMQKLKNGVAIQVNKNNNTCFVKHENVLIGIGEITNNMLKLNTYLLED